MTRLPPLLPFLVCLLAGAMEGAAAPAPQLTLATWNMEWLVSPRTANEARQHCRRAARATLPCDVALGLARSTTDLAALARYARQLDADVVALQEVEDAQTAALVFRGYAFCFSARTGLQNTGFAIRKGIAHRCAADLATLSLNDSTRRGAQLVLFPDGPEETWLLSIHLKSGCAREPLSSDRAACRTLRRQAPALAAWIRTQVAARRRFAVLGDFNRSLAIRPAAGTTADTAGDFWQLLAEGLPPGDALVNTAAGQPFHNCSRGQPYGSYIDYIVLGAQLAGAWHPSDLRHHGYRSLDARRYRLSDHCPVSIRLRRPLFR